MNRAECARVLGASPNAGDEELLARLRDEMRLWTQRANAPTVERRTLAAQKLQELSRVREALGFEPGASAASGGRSGGPGRPGPATSRPAPPPPSPSSGWPRSPAPNGWPPQQNSWPPQQSNWPSQQNGWPPAQPESRSWPPPQNGPGWPSGPNASTRPPFAFPPPTWRRSGTSPSGTAWANPAQSPYDFPGIEPAPLGQRFGAALVDVLIWFLVMLIPIGLGLPLLTTLVVIGYFGLLAYAEGRTGQSPGKYVMGVRVLGWNDGVPLGVGRAIWRMVTRVFGASFYLLGWVVAVFNPGRRAVHDFLAASVVVTCPPGTKSMNDYLDQVRQAG